MHSECIESLVPYCNFNDKSSNGDKMVSISELKDINSETLVLFQIRFLQKFNIQEDRWLFMTFSRNLTKLGTNHRIISNFITTP